MTELAHAGDAAAASVLAQIGRRLGYGLVGVVNVFNPELIVIGGGAIAAGELLLGPAREVVAERALPPVREMVSIVADRVRRRVGDARGGAAGAGLAVSGRLVVCPTPIGNLEDVTLRVLSALREADVVACEDTRRTRVLLDRYGVSGQLVSYHEHNEQARSAELVARMRSGAVVALVSDAGMPLVSDPGYVLVRACVAAGLPVEVLPGPSAAITALVASGLPAAEWRVRGLPAAQEGRAGAAVRVCLPARWWRSSRRGGCRRRWRCWRRWTRRGEVAVCRELTKVHEEVVRGTRGGAGGAVRGGAAAGRGGAGAGAGVRWSPARRRREPAGLEALRRLVEAGAHPRKAAGVVAELTGGQRERAVPGADGARRRSAGGPARAPTPASYVRAATTSATAP